MSKALPSHVHCAKNSIKYLKSVTIGKLKTVDTSLRAAVRSRSAAALSRDRNRFSATSDNKRSPFCVHLAAARPRSAPERDGDRVEQKANQH